jgi:hypothetical protein
MPYTVQFSDEEWEFYYDMCNQYAKDELASTYEQKMKRNQFNTTAMVHQTTTGKLAEWAVTLHFTEKENTISDPDMEIYPAWKKSFDADLQLDGYDLHVKSQSVESAQRFGTSWMFQYNGRGGGHRDPLLHLADGLVAFCVVDFTNKSVALQGICGFAGIRDRLREPVKKSLKNTKRCIYLEDLKQEDFLI